MENQTLNPSPFSFPEGLVGEIADYIYKQAPRPLHEIALAAALALMAGICGRSYSVSQTGLNLYLLMLAPTGTGKEAISAGINKLMTAVCSAVPAAADFLGPSSIASPQALVKYLVETPSCISVFGEFGLTIQQMSNLKASTHLTGLRQILLDIYHKSGPNDQYRPIIYSDKEKNTSIVLSPSFSVIGESTPETFYDGMTERFVCDGLLPRFSVIEYSGGRPKINNSPCENPPPDLIQKLGMLCPYTLSINSRNQRIQVRIDSAAMWEFDQFNRLVDELIDSSREVGKNLWNRAHLKAMKLAALVAVGVNPYDPVITSRIAIWAIRLEKYTVDCLANRFLNGDVGEENRELLRINSVIEVFNEYMHKSASELQNYDVRPEMHRRLIVTYTFLHRRLANTKPFRKEGNSQPTQLLKQTLSTLIHRGDIVQCGPVDMDKQFGFRGACYMLANTKLVLKKSG